MKDESWFGRGVGVKAKKIAVENGAGIYLLHMDRDARVSKESHPERETILVLEGAIKIVYVMHVDPTGFVRRKARSSQSIPPGMPHEIVADHPRGALVLVVASPDWSSGR